YLNVKEDYRTFITKPWKEHYSDLWIDNLLNIRHLYSIRFAKKDDVKTLNNLAKENSIYYITAIPEEIRLSRQLWLEKSGFPQTNNLILSNHHDKDYYVRYYEIDLYVEDRVPIIKYLENITTVIVKKQPWNEELWNDYECINSISELERII
ncbi:MAG: hypothetical protein BV456_11170, partial [Thermoplasmata archaeon M8B2D]